MKTNNRNLTSRLVAWLSSACVLLVVQAQALDVIGPTGVNYTVLADSSEYSSSYASTNLFDNDMTGIPVGTVLSDTTQYATASQTNAFVAFQLDKVYTNVGSIFYAQRAGNDPAKDKINVINIWADNTTPFFSAADPGRAPDAVIAVTNAAGAQWTEYFLTNTISGQYFLLELSQISSQPIPQPNNPGGSEFRLGADLHIPPTIGAMSDKTVYAGGTARLGATVNGSSPIRYTWFFGGTPLNNGGGISGADTADLIISNVALANMGAYSLTVTNDFGADTKSVNLTVVNAPINLETAAIIADHPMAFWQLNESSITMPAFDFAGTFNGTYGPDSIVGVAGPQPPTFPGFSSTNTALQTTGYDLYSPATVPAMNISTNDSVTILAWIYPDDSFGPQQPYTGIVFGRGLFMAAGLICSSDGLDLGYQWNGNGYGFDSGLVLPTNQWTMAAMVYRPSNMTLYLGTTNGIVLQAVDNTARSGQPFDVPLKIGIDTDVGESTRTFNGLIDDVAFFNRALSSDEINLIYEAGTGLHPTLQILSQTSTNVFLYQGESTTMRVTVSGAGVGYQWYVQNAPINGATNNSYAISDAKVSDSGNYYVVVTNQNNQSVTSAVISVTVPSYVLLPIDPSGSNYTGISDSSEYDSSYSASNLFNYDVAGIPVDTVLSDNSQWATLGQTNAFVAFQLDKVHTNVDAILYAQRSGASMTMDKMNVCNIWASANTPFAAADPGTPPDSVVELANATGNQWTGYLLTNTISGQYFLVQLAQTSGAGGNPGGTEFRLGVTVTPVPLTFSASPSGLILNWPLGATLQQADNVNGPWTTVTGVTSGVPIPMTAARQFYRILY